MDQITINSSGLILSSIFEIFLPFILSFIWTKYFNGKIYSIFIGILGFICSIGLEGIFLSMISKIIKKTSTTFYIIGIISPGLFEETGRYTCLKYLLKKDKLKNISVSYGIGHGGIESIMVGITLLSYLFLGEIFIEKGILKESITFYTCLMSSCERLFSVILHISLSIIVYKAVKKEKNNYYIFSIILHDILDIIGFLKVKNIITSIFIIELMIAIFSLCTAFYSYKLYINFEEKEEQNINNKSESSIKINN